MSSPHPNLFSQDDPSVPGFYPASRTAYLLLDFHTLFVNKAGGSSAPAATSVAAEFRQWALSRDIPVIHALLDTSLGPTPTCKDRERFAGIMGTLASEGGEEPESLTRGWKEGADAVYLRQPGQVSALKSRGLGDWLRAKGIVSLVMAGLSTTGCVLRTALAAADDGFVVTVLEDGCADPAEGAHGFAVEKLLRNRGYAVTAGEFRDGFEKRFGKE